MVTRTRAKPANHSAVRLSSGYVSSRSADWKMVCPIRIRQLRLNAARLRQEHEDFDIAINAMIQTGCDALRVQRMKKKKLALKDRLSLVEDQIIPDIIA